MAVAARFIPGVTKTTGPTRQNILSSQNVMDIIAGGGATSRATVGTNMQGPLRGNPNSPFKYQAGYVTADTAARNAQNALANRMALLTKKDREPLATPVSTTPRPSGPVQVTPEPTPVVTEEVPVEQLPASETPVEAAVELTPTPYSVYDDPTYQQALAQAQSAFNLDRAAALANMQYEQRPIERRLEERIPAAEAERRRLAGNFARRGMAGGRYGALTRAEAEVNAREIGLRTGLREQIAELTRQFNSNFGAEGTDWLGTRRGYEAQQAAIQAALQNRLAGLTTVG